MKVIAIIPAAGLGTRMAAGGAKVSKQFTEIAGTPILIHTLRRFAASPRITEMVVALRKPELAQFAPRLKQEPYAARVRLVEGGESRQQSVANALAAIAGGRKQENDGPTPLPAQDLVGDIVLVHDGVRPFIDTAIIDSVIQAVEKHGAAIAGLPAVDTVKQVERTADGAIITSTIPRERVVMAQTPQGFRLNLLRRAFAEAEADGFVGTDEASLVERAGRQVAVVMGSPRNIKITAPADLAIAELYAREMK